jgi:hypothetical protein
LHKSLAAFGAVLGAGAVLAALTSPAYASVRAGTPGSSFTQTAPRQAFPPPLGASAAPAGNAVNSLFEFCNSNIACFDATLHYVSRTEFQLQGAQLIDSLCDNRSVYADVYDQNGFLGEFSNSMGCHTVADFPIETISDGNGVTYVQLDLYACNFWGCSSVAWSLKHWSPY